MPEDIVEETAVTINNVHSDWPDPIPLDTGEIPEFPLDALPEQDRMMVDDVAEKVQIDPAFPASCLLGVYALSIHRRVAIKAGPQKEETGLWIVSAAEVSERKSASFSPILNPIYEFEKQEEERTKSSRADGMAQYKTLEARIVNLQKKAGNEDNPVEQTNIRTALAEAIYRKERLPSFDPPQLIADNITEEAVALIMRSNGERLCLVSTEPTLLDQMTGTKDRRSLLDIFLKAYSGDPLKVNRVGRGYISLQRPILTVVVAAQPGAIREFMRNQRFEERGVLSRFLFVPCRKSAGTRFWHGRDANPDIVDRYNNHIMTMIKETRERNLTLSPAAMEIYSDHYDSIERRQIQGGDLENNGWAGKQAGRTLRIAAALHCAEDSEQDIIDPSTMSRAAALSEYFIKGWLFVQALSREPEELQKLRSLLEWVLIQHKPILTFREIFASMRKRYKNSDELRIYMNKLCEHGHIRKLDTARSESYVISPYHRERLNSYTSWDT